MKTKQILLGLAVSLLTLVGLSGCASPFRSAGSVLTTKGNWEMGNLVEQNTFRLQDIICFQVDITWDDVNREYQTEMEWNWYDENGKLVAHHENDRAILRGAPDPRYWLQSAADLGVGHFRVECVAGGKLLASQEFDIKGNPHS
ncbi:MAG TPA: hypothetical protein VNU49_01370 [Opitutaceae bacterium]|jgi:hypothetical protein|nr:hypothetical protein [Opitutaceae bacterium]